MGSGGEYISVWPGSEAWRDPITNGSNKQASWPKNITAKHAEDGRECAARARGYSAAEAAQDARKGACLTAWPAGESWNIPSVAGHVHAVKSKETGNG